MTEYMLSEACVSQCCSHYSLFVSCWLLIGIHELVMLLTECLMGANWLDLFMLIGG